MEDKPSLQDTLALIKHGAVQPKQLYRHTKTGNVYLIKELTVDEATLEARVSYSIFTFPKAVSMNELTFSWSRPYNSFVGYDVINGEMVKRFVKID